MGKSRKIVLGVVLAVVLVCVCGCVSYFWRGGPLDRVLCADAQPNTIHNGGCPYEIEDFDCASVDDTGYGEDCKVNWDKVRENH
ncbi:hypothetical protein [Glycomyces sp. NPDC047010]|uniref:hypothetical protein n=1 Tax=Glycomyces sp. NPDC047010 TaxID=3155023 RepID=UPI0033E49817